jgi:hypothetical protein
MTPHNWLNHLRSWTPTRLLPSAVGSPQVLGREPHRDRRAAPRVEVADRGLLDPPGAVDGRGRRMVRTFPFEALSRIYPGEYGAEGELEIRQVFEPEE